MKRFQMRHKIITTLISILFTLSICILPAFPSMANESSEDNMIITEFTDITKEMDVAGDLTVEKCFCWVSLQSKVNIGGDLTLNPGAFSWVTHESTIDIKGNMTCKDDSGFEAAHETTLTIGGDLTIEENSVFKLFHEAKVIVHGNLNYTSDSIDEYLNNGKLVVDGAVNKLAPKVNVFVNLTEIEKAEDYVKLSAEVNSGDSIAWELISEDEKAKIYTDAVCEKEITDTDNVTTVYVKGESNKEGTIKAYSNLDRTVYATSSFIIPAAVSITDPDNPVVGPTYTKYIPALICGLVILLLIAFSLLNKKRMLSIAVTGVLLLSVFNLNANAEGITISNDTDLSILRNVKEDVHITSDITIGNDNVSSLINVNGNVYIENNSTVKFASKRIDIKKDLIVEDGSTLRVEDVENLHINGNLIVYPKGIIEANAKTVYVNGNIYLYNKNGLASGDGTHCSCKGAFLVQSQFLSIASVYEIPISYTPDIRITGINLSKDNSVVEISAQYNDYYAFKDKLIWTAESAGNPVELYSDEKCTTKLDGSPTELTTVYIKVGEGLDCTVKATSYYYDDQNASCNISIK